MKKVLNPVLSSKVVDELRLVCCMCDKKITGYYASFQEGGTCSKKCMLERDKQPRFPGHSSEDFEKLHNL